MKIIQSPNNLHHKTLLRISFVWCSVYFYRHISRWMFSTTSPRFLESSNLATYNTLRWHRIISFPPQISLSMLGRGIFVKDNGQLLILGLNKVWSWLWFVYPCRHPPLLLARWLTLLRGLGRCVSCTPWLERRCFCSTVTAFAALPRLLHLWHET